jgi:FkbM family methyltransferase
MDFSNIIPWIKDKWFIKNPKLRRAVTRALEGTKDQEVSLLGSRLCVNALREHGYLRASRLALKSSVFGDEAAVLIHLAGLLSHVDTFVDVGANVGLYSTVLGQMQRILPKLKVVSFEADPDTFLRLKRNVESVVQGAMVHHAAAAEVEETLRFVRGAVSHVTTKADLANDYSLPDEGFEVKSRRLDAVDVPGARLMMKIDVEGQEWSVLQGARGWFEQKRCVCVYLDGYERDPKIREFLLEQGFELRDGRTLLPVDAGTFALLALRGDWLASIGGMT